MRTTALRRAAGARLMAIAAPQSIAQAGPQTSLRRNAALNLIANAGYAACQWAVMLMLARAGSAHLLGLFSLGMAVTAPLMLLTNLQLRNLLATDVGADRYALGHYLALRLATLSVAVLLIAAIAAALHGDREEYPIILAAAAAKSVESIGELGYGLLQRHERFARLSLSMLAKGVLGLAGMSIGVLSGAGVVAGTLLMAAGWLAVLVCFDLPNAVALVGWAELVPMVERARLVRLFRSAAPLGLVACLLSLNATIPIYVLEHWYGASAVGNYTAITALLAAGNMAVIALGNACAPRLARYYASGLPGPFRSLCLRLIAVCGGLGLLGMLVAMVAGGPLLAAIYGPAYADQGTLLVWLCAATALSWSASASGFAVTAARLLKVQFPLSLCATLTSLVASLLLIPGRGPLGAAISYLIMSAVLAIAYATTALYASRSFPPTLAPAKP
jgi:O-antigen/teichoic acid export membrane protein